MFGNSVKLPTEKSAVFFDPLHNDYVRRIDTWTFVAVDDGRRILYSLESMKRLREVTLD